MMTEKDISLFDAYLQNQLTKDERAAFENELANSPALAQKFEGYTKQQQLIADAFGYENFKEELKQTHRKLYGKRKKSILLRPAFLIPLGAAASLLLLIMITNFNGATDATSKKGYQELSNFSESATDDYSKTGQGAGTVVTEFTPSANGGTFGGDALLSRLPRGTAFLISSSGYFITAKHLVGSQNTITLQQKKLQMTFDAVVVYTDSIADLAILKCPDSIAVLFEPVPYKFVKNAMELGQDVFTLGYPKKDVVYTAGVVSSETGYNSDTLYFEVSMPSNMGNSGAPLFDSNGRLTGIITANHAGKQSVTYALRHEQINRAILQLSNTEPIDLSKNYPLQSTKRSKLIKAYRPFIFEVH